ncbi:MAG: saccharopine dehydrogenase NADP-binding domain-containing protein [Hyphomicrobium sp.]|jgi:saccharopine dehydrogenase-like NADP-dependent oxidoreductase
MGRVAIVGGYGAFGAHAAARLAGDGGLEIVVAGRSLAKARDGAEKLLARGARAHIEAAQLDATTASAQQLRALAPNVLINASGPFQGQDYSLARACIECGCHYVDLADARRYVCDVTRLNAQAQAANVCVVSGASSVPGLSSAVVLQLTKGLETMDEVHIGISPGNSFDPGIATTASILGAAGKPFKVRVDGRWVTAHGWQRLNRYCFPEIGARWMADVDVPDLELLPANYPQLRTARFAAGLDVGAFHLGVWALSWLARSGVLADPGRLAPLLLAAKRRLSMLGSNTGGMFVHVSGRDRQGVRRERAWHLIARSGDGPYVPAIASVILARRLLAGNGPPAGAMTCFGLFKLAEFEAEVADLDITCSIEREAN